MLNYPRKFKRTLFFLFFLQLMFFALMYLAGCGENKNIPAASILSTNEVTLMWEDVPGAAAYNVLYSTSPGITVLNSHKIPNASNPIIITDLSGGTTYFFIVTVEDDSGQIRKSKEISYTVIKAKGSIQLGDILSQFEADAATSDIENVPTALNSESKPANKTEEQKQQIATVQSSTKSIICFGDSLTFGIGASEGMDYPSQLAKMIGIPVMNEGIPGDTTGSALRRLNRDVLSKNPDIVLITLGGNDLKNGVSKDRAFGNLKVIILSIQQQGAKVIIGGLKFPGLDRGFGEAYADLSKETGAMLIPNILAGIMKNPTLMSDSVHPNDSGYRIIAQRYYNIIKSSE